MQFLQKGPKMAKRYHQSKKDRHHESVGEKKHLAHLHHGHHSAHHPHHHDPREHSEHHMHHSLNEHERAQYRHHGGAEHYAGMEPRRRQEMRDAGMIHEDHNAVANLPQMVKYVPYEKPMVYLPEGLDDTIRGIDHQMEYDYEHERKNWMPKKV